MSVTSPAGFVASGMHVGIRRKRPDLCIVRSLEPADGETARGVMGREVGRAF